LTARFATTIGATLARRFPAKRILVKSENGPSRILAVSTAQQIAGVAAGGLAVLAVLVVLGGGLFRVWGAAPSVAAGDSSARSRIEALADQRDAALRRAATAAADRDTALAVLSASEDRARAARSRADRLAGELKALRDGYARLAEGREAARRRADDLAAALAERSGAARNRAAHIADLRRNVVFLGEALERTAAERDAVAAEAGRAFARIEEMELDARLARERTDRIFAQLEGALSRAVAPLDGAFRKIGLNPEDLIAQLAPPPPAEGGNLRLAAFSTKGAPMSAEAVRAGEILDTVERIDLYRRAAEKLPLSMPVMDRFRFTSPFGMRTHPISGRREMHDGLDMAAPAGTPIRASGEGTVTFAGWKSGYGRTVIVRHGFGFETLYPHLSRIRVKKGQKVSRGERIGDMGSSGRSTGSHLHYEVRVGGKPVNPMTYIRAARDVF